MNETCLNCKFFDVEISWCDAHDAETYHTDHKCGAFKEDSEADDENN